MRIELLTARFCILTVCNYSEHSVTFQNTVLTFVLAKGYFETCRWTQTSSIRNLSCDRSVAFSKACSSQACSSFKFQYSFFSLSSSSSCLRLLSRHLIPFFRSLTCFRRHFLRKVWPIQLAFLLLIVCRTFLFSLVVCVIFLHV